MSSYDINITVSSSGRKILKSGSVQAFSDEGVEFHIDNMKLVVVFPVDEKDKSQRIETDVKSKVEMKLSLYNFTNSLGTANSTPMKLGNLTNGNELFFSFVVYKIGVSPQLLHYTFYEGQ